ncbi:hypothetical protein M5689_014503 [Euphorbia peplus]|nr:hypothetical protein M5689_014503 [Euphorbia peplus]
MSLFSVLYSPQSKFLKAPMDCLEIGKVLEEHTVGIPEDYFIQKYVSSTKTFLDRITFSLKLSSFLGDLNAPPP